MKKDNDKHEVDKSNKDEDIRTFSEYNAQMMDLEEEMIKSKMKKD